VVVSHALQQVRTSGLLCLLVYDMQAGIVKQISEWQEILDRCKPFLDAARRAGFGIFVTRPAQTKEAAAGLQYLVCELLTISAGANGTSSTAGRLSELKAIQAELSTGIRAESNGPHLVTNGERLFNWLGERAQANYETRFLVRTGRRVTIVPVEDIDWIEAAGDYVTLHVGNKSHLVRQTMSGLEAQLDPDHFIRVHRSAIVQASRICELESLTNREYLLRLSNGTKVRASRRFSDRIERWLR
jgi:DNA-binding LytR/AlgR family response regulator